jgi:molybdate transport system substrate-binding protein
MATASGATTKIRILSAAAMGEIVRDLGDAYEDTTGIQLSAEFTRSPLVRDRVRAGEAVDIVITTQSRIEELARENKVLSDSTAIVAHSRIGVAMRQDGPSPTLAQSKLS